MAPLPIEPGDGDSKHRHNANLHDPEQKHQCRQHCSERHASHKQTDSPQHRLPHGHEDNAERDAANRLPGEVHCLFAACSCEASPEPSQVRHGAVASGKKHGCNQNGEHKLSSHGAQTAELSQQPASGHPRIRCRGSGEFIRTGRGEIAP